MMDQEIQKDTTAGLTDNINSDRPGDAPPVPPEIVKRYDKQIGSVWWHAKGRDKDPTIGIEISGLRKTFGGYVWNDWWYFMKVVHQATVEGERPQCYWYRKRKVPDPENPEHYEIEEEYIGSNLIDPDTGDALDVPQELQHSYGNLCN